MRVDDLFSLTESRYRQKLEDFFITKWGDTILLSHNLDHHRRVWRYAKVLLLEDPPGNPENIISLSCKLIMACYLHDLGMSVEKGERHGIHGSNLCREFLSMNNLPLSEFSDLLQIIEKHDDKNYSKEETTNLLLKLLSAADDLDAFGYIGIFRYAEIYLTRGIEFAKIGYEIKKNALRRFQNLERNFPENKDFIKEKKTGFLILDNFFSGFNCQVEKNSVGKHEMSGYVLIINIIRELTDSGITYEKLKSRFEKYPDDPVVRDFSRGFFQELAENE